MTVKEQLLQESVQNAQKAMHELHKAVFTPNAKFEDTLSRVSDMEDKLARLIATINL